MNIYITSLEKNLFSHIVSDLEYLGETTYYSLQSSADSLQVGDKIVFVGIDNRYYTNTSCICTEIKEVCFDDSPATVLILESKSNLFPLNNNFLEYTEAMEIERGILTSWGNQPELYRILDTQLYKILFDIVS